MDSYIRRQRHWQHEQAVQMMNVYAEAMSAGKSADNAPPAGERRNVPPEAMFGDFGAKVKVAGDK